MVEGKKVLHNGFTLLEIMISFVLLTLIGGTILISYSGIFVGTRKADVQIAPLNTLELIGEIFRERATKTPNLNIAKGAYYGDYIYQVEDVTLNENPVSTSKSAIMMRRLTIHVFFYMTDRLGHKVEQEYVTTMLLGE